MPPSEQEIQQAVLQALGPVLQAGGTAGMSPYQAARQEFAGIPRFRGQDPFGLAVTRGVAGVAGAFGIEAPKPTTKKLPFIEAPSGKILYANGVIYDPATRQTLFPPGFAEQSDLAGSDAWLSRVQDEWSDAKARAWRKKLWDQGYQGAGLLQSDKGGMAHDLIEALREYHFRRYSNYGTVKPLVPGGGDISSREALRKSADWKAIKAEIKGWGNVVFGEELDDQTADFLTERVERVARRLMRQKGWTPEQAIGTPSTAQSPASGAFLRVEEEFSKRPAVKAELREMEEDEMDESLRESIISISQLAAI